VREREREREIGFGGVEFSLKRVWGGVYVDLAPVLIK
jgi:hypothetical protein